MYSYLFVVESYSYLFVVLIKIMYGCREQEYPSCAHLDLWRCLLNQFHSNQLWLWHQVYISPGGASQTSMILFVVAPPSLFSTQVHSLSPMDHTCQISISTVKAYFIQHYISRIILYCPMMYRFYVINSNKLNNWK